eukprot:TRINITY_DN4830_c1_g1_i1.p1 TRINITY_DN4830_c1_g1~~TRINITY_DN4830_c1_g1_i1.p1  ORF type:complete len:310 (-),score=156.25 TRINITY_DN4830_c1_g1_i1:189-1118(-)
MATVETGHSELIHDISFDHYGRRLATCSSDRQIKIWERISDSWTCCASWEAHSGPILRVCWAHPEFGQVIASCSTDKVVNIWEEPARDPNILNSSVNTNSNVIGTKGWISKTKMVDFKDTVNDIKFSPRQFGLKLATSCSDGVVRVYEATDTVNLESWQMEQFDLPKNKCLSWNPAIVGTSILVIGTDDVKNNLSIWELNENNRQWSQVQQLVGPQRAITDVSWAPNIGRSFHLIASASKDGSVLIWKLTLNGRTFDVENFTLPHAGAKEIWRLEWNITGTVLAGSGDDGIIWMWKQDSKNNWIRIQAK